MSSLRLTTSMQQKMILTPQLRQRIEMLQMTSLELQDLIEQEMVANPILEEVQPGEEIGEISDNILDQNSSGAEDAFATTPGDRAESTETVTEIYDSLRAEIASENGAGELDQGQESEGADETARDAADSFEE